MLSIVFSARVMVALTMWVHAAGVAALVRSLMGLRALPPKRGWPITLMCCA